MSSASHNNHGFFEHDDRRIDTRFTELVAGIFAMIYGWKATQVGYSEFQQILALKDFAFEWGVGLFGLGILMNAFAFSRFPKIRAALAFALLGGWGGIVVLFLTNRNPGIPLWNGLAWIGVAAVVIAKIVIKEKRARSAPACLD